MLPERYDDDDDDMYTCNIQHLNLVQFKLVFYGVSTPVGYLIPNPIHMIFNDLI